MKLNYTVEVKDWDNLDSYPCIYNGSSLSIAMMHFKEQHLKGEDVILFIEDENGNTIDVLENYNEVDNIIKCNELFTPNDEELKKQHKEVSKQKEIYVNMYKEEINKNDTLKKENERLTIQVRQQQREINKLKDQAESKNNKLYWYAYRLRGFSLGCQPKGHIEVNHNIGRHGIIAYDRQLTPNELNEYELIPYNKAI